MSNKCPLERGKEVVALKATRMIYGPEARSKWIGGNAFRTRLPDCDCFRVESWEPTV